MTWNIFKRLIWYKFSNATTQYFHLFLVLIYFVFVIWCFASEWGLDFWQSLLFSDLLVGKYLSHGQVFYMAISPSFTEILCCFDIQVSKSILIIWYNLCCDSRLLVIIRIISLPGAYGWFETPNFHSDQWCRIIKSFVILRIHPYFKNKRIFLYCSF